MDDQNKKHNGTDKTGDRPSIFEQIGALPEPQRTTALADTEELLLMNLAKRFEQDQVLTADQVDELARLAAAETPTAQVMDWFAANVPNFGQLITEVTDETQTQLEQALIPPAGLEPAE